MNSLISFWVLIFFTFIRISCLIDLNGHFIQMKCMRFFSLHILPARCFCFFIFFLFFFHFLTFCIRANHVRFRFLSFPFICTHFCLRFILWPIDTVDCFTNQRIEWIRSNRSRYVPAIYYIISEPIYSHLNITLSTFMPKLKLQNSSYNLIKYYFSNGSNLFLELIIIGGWIVRQLGEKGRKFIFRIYICFIQLPTNQLIRCLQSVFQSIRAWIDAVASFHFCQSHHASICVWF